MQHLSPLTLKEKSVLKFIEHFFLSNEIAPSFMEIKSHFGFASNNSVQRYLKQLTKKGYIYIPPGNQKRAITILHSANTLHKNLTSSPLKMKTQTSASSVMNANIAESCSLPLLGKIAAGSPIEKHNFNETLDVPQNFVAHPNISFALEVEGSSMIEDGIFDGDYIIVEDVKVAQNGETVVAVIDNEATLKKFFFHEDKKLIELRPSNSTMESMWHRPNKVQIRGVLKNLLRKY